MTPHYQDYQTYLLQGVLKNAWGVTYIVLHFFLRVTQAWKKSPNRSLFSER
jgi:hypothetical protein